MKCLICKSLVNTLRGLSIHISTKHKITLKQYYDKYLNKYNEGICICGNKTKFNSLSKGYNKFCSRECSYKDIARNQKIAISKEKWHSDPRNKNHMKDLALKQWADPTSKINKISQSEKVKMKKIERMKNIHSNLEIQKKRSDSLKKSWSSERKKKQSEKMKKFWNNNQEYKTILSLEMTKWKAAWMNTFIKNPSKPQVEIFDLVYDICNGYAVLNYPLLNYSIDIAIPHLMVAIEYDGSYWHQNLEKDIKRQTEIEKQGWTVIRYKDYIPDKDDLLNDIINCDGVTKQ